MYSKSCGRGSWSWSSSLSFPVLLRSGHRTAFYLVSRVLILCAGTNPNSRKKSSENEGANENLSGGFAASPGIAPRVAPRIVGFVLIIGRERPFREGNFVRIPRMEFPIPRAAPRIPRNSPRAPRMKWPFRSESVFPEIGAVPRLLS